MTDEELKQWVREQVEQILFDGLADMVLSDEGTTAGVKKVASRLLSLKKPDGTPAIGIISDDQNIPLNLEKTPESFDAYAKCHKDMAGFVRLVGGKK